MNPTFMNFDFIFQIQVMVWAALVTILSWWAGAVTLRPVSQLIPPPNTKMSFRIADMYVLVVQCFLMGWFLSSIHYRNPYWHYEAMGVIWLLLIWWWYLGISMLRCLPNEVPALRRAVFLGFLIPLGHGGVLFPFIALPTAFMFNEPEVFKGLSVEKQKVIQAMVMVLIPLFSFLGSKMILFWCVQGQPNLFKLVENTRRPVRPTKKLRAPK